MMPTQLSKKLVDQYRELVESFYLEPPDSEIIGSFLQSDEKKGPCAASAISSGKNVCSKKSKKRKDGDGNVYTFSSTTEVKDIRSCFNPNKAWLFEGTFFWGEEGEEVNLTHPLHISKRTYLISI